MKPIKVFVIEYKKISTPDRRVFIFETAADNPHSCMSKLMTWCDENEIAINTGNVRESGFAMVEFTEKEGSDEQINEWHKENGGEEEACSDCGAIKPAGWEYCLTCTSKHEVENGGRNGTD